MRRAGSGTPYLEVILSKFVMQILDPDLGASGIPDARISSVARDKDMALGKTDWLLSGESRLLE
jgi:hypothetical protein